MRLECNKHFTPNTSVEARFNRCIIFDGRKYHSGGDYFGNDITTGRLTLVFFGRSIMRTINHEGVAVEVLVEDRLFVARSAVPKELCEHTALEYHMIKDVVQYQ